MAKNLCRAESGSKNLGSRCQSRNFCQKGEGLSVHALIPVCCWKAEMDPLRDVALCGKSCISCAIIIIIGEYTSCVLCNIPQEMKAQEAMTDSKP